MGIDWLGIARDAVHIVEHLADDDYRGVPRSSPTLSDEEGECILTPEEERIAESMYQFYANFPQAVLQPTFQRLRDRFQGCRVSDSSDHEIRIFNLVSASIEKLIVAFEVYLASDEESHTQWRFADWYEGMWGKADDDAFGLVRYEGYLWGPRVSVNSYRFSWWLEARRAQEMANRHLKAKSNTPQHSDVSPPDENSSTSITQTPDCNSQMSDARLTYEPEAEDLSRSEAAYEAAMDKSLELWPNHGWKKVILDSLFIEKRVLTLPEIERNIRQRLPEYVEMPQHDSQIRTGMSDMTKGNVLYKPTQNGRGYGIVGVEYDAAGDMICGLS